MIYAGSKVLTREGLREITDMQTGFYVWGYRRNWKSEYDGAGWFRVMRVKRSDTKIKMQWLQSVFGHVICDPDETEFLYGDESKTPFLPHSITQPPVSYFKGFYKQIPIDIYNDEDDARNFFCGLMTTSETVYGSGTGKRAERKIKLSKKDYKITEWLKGNKFIHGSFGSFETSFRSGSIVQMNDGTPQNIRAFLCGLCTTDAMKDDQCTNADGVTRAMVQITLPGHENCENIRTLLNSVGLQACLFKGRSGEEKVDGGNNAIIMIDKDKEYFDECIGQYMLRDYLASQKTEHDGCPTVGQERFGVIEHIESRDMEAQACMMVLEYGAHFWSNGMAVREHKT